MDCFMRLERCMKTKPNTNTLKTPSTDLVVLVFSKKKKEDIYDIYVDGIQ